MRFHHQLQFIEQEDQQSPDNMSKEDPAFDQIFPELGDDGQGIFFQCEDQDEKKGDKTCDQYRNRGLNTKNPPTSGIHAKEMPRRESSEGDSLHFIPSGEHR